MVRTAFIIAFGLVSPSAFAAIPSASQVGMVTAKDVLDVCQDKEVFSVSLCVGFLEGIRQRDDLSPILKSGTKWICDLPAGVTNGQKMEVVVRYIRNNPAEWHMLGGAITIKALQIGFCRK